MSDPDMLKIERFIDLPQTLDPYNPAVLDPGQRLDSMFLRSSPKYRSCSYRLTNVSNYFVLLHIASHTISYHHTGLLGERDAQLALNLDFYWKRADQRNSLALSSKVDLTVSVSPKGFEYQTHTRARVEEEYVFENHASLLHQSLTLRYGYLADVLNRMLLAELPAEKPLTLLGDYVWDL
jgi:hypothetical protein